MRFYEDSVPEFNKLAAEILSLTTTVFNKALYKTGLYRMLKSLS